MRSALEIAQAVMIRRWVDDPLGMAYFAGWDAYMSHKELPDDASDWFKRGWGDAYAYCETQEGQQ
jgi:hypothetical protein